MTQQTPLRPGPGTGGRFTAGTRRWWRRTGIGLVVSSLISMAVIGGVQITSAQADDNTVRGIDVSHWNPNVDWNAVRASGMRFAYMKATEGRTYTDDVFPSHYNGAAQAGLLRGAYHYVLPGRGSGAEQADFFIANGGGWTDDGKTMPGMFDFEWPPNGTGDACYGLNQAQMQDWIRSLVYRYHEVTTRWPIIYTNVNWWNPCVGAMPEFDGKVPLWLARYSSSPGSPAVGWSNWTFWQYTGSGAVNGVEGDVDMNVFNGSYTDLETIARGRPVEQPPATTAPATTNPAPTTEPAPPTKPAPTKTNPPEPTETGAPPEPTDTGAPPETTPAGEPTTAPEKTTPPAATKPVETGTGSPSQPAVTAAPGKTAPGSKLPVTGAGLGTWLAASLLLLAAGVGLLLLGRRPVKR